MIAFIVGFAVVIIAVFSLIVYGMLLGHDPLPTPKVMAEEEDSASE
jgi:hypothetical protein